MTSKRHSPANQSHERRVRELCDELLDEVLRVGFHGHARLELTIAEGTIQRIGRTVERIEKVR